MIRLLGAALVIGATGTMGALGVLSLRRRVRVLEGLIVSLQLMESEICSRMTPMREVLDRFDAMLLSAPFVFVYMLFVM